MVLREVVSLPSVLLYLSVGQGPILTSIAPPWPLFKIPVSGMGVCLARGCGVARGGQGWGSSAPCWTVVAGRPRAAETGQGNPVSAEGPGAPLAVVPGVSVSSRADRKMLVPHSSVSAGIQFLSPFQLRRASFAAEE